MVSPPGFSSWTSMQSSQWLQDIKKKFDDDVWPEECVRCWDTEQSHGQSIRKDSIERHKILSYIKDDYLILGGVLDNICNSACQSCNSQLSTKIGSLSGKKYIKINNQHLFDRLPVNRIVELDLNGGEPTASPTYKNLLENLPSMVKIVRINTNGSRMLPNLPQILDKGITVIVTLSLDGTSLIHDYVRWPILWERYQSVIEEYILLRQTNKNLKLQAWSTLHCLNIGDVENIIDFCRIKNIDHSWAWLETPNVLSAKHKNQFTLSARKKLSSCQDPVVNSFAEWIAIGNDNQRELDSFIAEQDQLRSINIGNFLCV